MHNRSEGPEQPERQGMVTINAVETVPSVEEWTRWMENASAEEALRMWQHAEDCLRTAIDLGSDPLQTSWGEHIGSAQRVLRDRGIRFQ